MSRLGKQPAVLPKGVEASFAEGILTIKGPKGTLTLPTRDVIAVTVEDGMVTLTPQNDTQETGALWGTYAAYVHAMIEGVTKGYERKLEIEGVGYRAEMQGQNLKMNLGFSHPVLLEVPSGITATVEKNVITLTGIDKHALGQFAANVRKVKKPEPYKGKGIRYEGEYIIRKQGKKAV